MALGDRSYKVLELDIKIGRQVAFVIAHEIEAKDADSSDSKEGVVVVQWEDLRALLTQDEQSSLDAILLKMADVPKLKVSYLANATVR